MRFSGGVAGVAAAVLLIGVAAIPAARAAGVAADGVAAGRVATATPVSAPGTTLYVYFNGACDDSGPGTAAEPFCTVQAAANVVDPGQTVDIAADTANADPQSLSITRSGTPGEPITFAWTGTGADPVLSPDKQTGEAAVTLDDVHDVTLSRLTIESWDTDDAIDVIGSSDISLANLDLIHRVTSDTVQPASADVMIDGASSDVTVARTNFQSGTPLEEVLAKPGAQQVTLADNLLYAGGAISGFTLDGATDAAVTNNTLLLDCTSSTLARTLVTMADGSSGSVENNILEPVGGTCTSPTVGLSVDASSAGGVTADYNAFLPEGTAVDYSWAGTSYADPAAFAATGQGTHDITLTSAVETVPAEGSPAINSGNCSAPGVPSTDFEGDPWVRDPLATDAGLGNGGCYVSRGAYARQDSLPFTSTAPPANPAGYPAGAVPFSTGLTVTGAATSPWGEPVSYTVNFGDGSAPVPAVPGTAVTHTYTAAGQYTITISAADVSGSTSTDTLAPVYALPDQGPTAALSAAPVGLGSSLGIDPDTAGFTSSDGGVPDWEIGTSTIIYVAGQASVSVIPNGTWDYTFAEPGSHTTTLTVTDKLGRTATATATITVGDEPQDAYPTTDYNHSVAAHGLVKIPLANLEGGCCARGALVDVRVTDDSKAGYVVVYPDGTSRPDLSTVQFQAGRAAENSTLATGGSTIDFYNGSAGSINLQVVRFGLDTIMTAGTGSYGETYAPVTPVTVLPRTEVAGNHQVTFAVAACTASRPTRSTSSSTSPPQAARPRAASPPTAPADGGQRRPTPTATGPRGSRSPTSTWCRLPAARSSSRTRARARPTSPRRWSATTSTTGRTPCSCPSRRGALTRSRSRPTARSRSRSPGRTASPRPAPPPWRST